MEQFNSEWAQSMNGGNGIYPIARTPEECKAIKFALKRKRTSQERHSILAKKMRRLDAFKKATMSDQLKLIEMLSEAIEIGITYKL